MRFKLDNTVYSSPINWKDCAHVWEKDTTDRILSLKLDTIFTWIDDAFDYIYSVWVDDWCATINASIEIQNSSNIWETIHTGKIFVSEAVFDDWQKTVDCKISDNDWAALIKENKNLEFDLKVARSKNDESISAATAIGVEFHTVASVGPVYDATETTCYRVEDAFTFLVAAMSDGAMSFSSTIFGSGGTYDGLCITTGQEIINQSAGSAISLVTSYKTLFDEINKIVRIYAVVEDAAGTPTLRIEDEEYFYNTATAITLTNIRELTYNVDAEQLYSHVNMGSLAREDDDIPSGGTTLSFPKTQFWSWDDETYNVNGECNLDNKLDILAEWLRDSNSIENIRLNNALSGGDEDADKIFLVMVDIGTPNQSQGTDFLGDGNYYYNENINNSSVTDNWICGIHNGIFIYVADQANEMSAYMSADDNITGVVTQNVAFDTENYDIGLNYDNALYKYTVPASGVYSVFVFLLQGMTNNAYDYSDSSTTARIYFRRRNSGGGVIEQWLMESLAANELNTGPIYIASSSPDLSLNAAATDTFTVEVDGLLASTDITVEGGSAYSIFQVNATPTSGGIYKTCNAESSKILEYKFNSYLTKTQFDSIIANPRNRISFNGNLAWTKRIKYNYWTGDTEFELITDQNNLQ